MLIHSAEITGSVQFNNTDVSGITNVSGFATTASVDAVIVKTGSFATTSSVNELQSKTGSYTSTSSFDAYSSSINTFTSSATTRLNTIESVTGSFASTSSVNNLQSVTGSYASTGSNQFNGNQSISGSITSNGTITAQTLVVQTVTSSIEFVTGSTKNGSLAENTHQFTGSVLMTGSLSVVTTGTELQVNASGVNIGNALTDNHVISGSLRINPNGLFVSSSGNVGIGSTSPTFKLETLGTSVIVAGFGRSDYGATNVTLVGLSGYRDVYKSAIGVVRTGDYDVGDIIVCLNSAANSTVVSASDEKIRIKSNGNVGIGTTSPSGSLHIVGTNATNRGQLSIQSNDTNNAARVSFYYHTTLQGNIGTTSGDFYSEAVNNYILYAGGSERMRITSAGVVQPGANGTQDLGTSSLRWGTIYTSDLSLSNGIGDYTIVEGEEKLYLYNNKNNKVYSFVLQEEDPLTATPKKS